MNTILKVTLDLANMVVKQLPKGAVIRHVGEQRGLIVLWFETDFDLMDREGSVSVEERRFFMLGDGNPIPEGAVYLGTVPMASFVRHVFEQVSA